MSLIRLCICILLVTCVRARGVGAADPEGIQITGKLAKWHCVTLTFDGPETSERANPNPFTDYRLDVLFAGPQGKVYSVPGFYAADGNAAITSADSGNKWRVHFAPDAEGQWSYQVRFLRGEGVALARESERSERRICGWDERHVSGRAGRWTGTRVL